jgi:hypothetical protein
VVESGCHRTEYDGDGELSSLSSWTSIGGIWQSIGTPYRQCNLAASWRSSGVAAGCCVKFPACSKREDEARKASILFCDLKRSARNGAFLVQFLLVKSGVIRGAAQWNDSRYHMSAWRSQRWYTLRTFVSRSSLSSNFFNATTLRTDVSQQGSASVGWSYVSYQCLIQPSL